MKHDGRIDAYIGRQAEFARPILGRLRALVHDACPAVEETLKWGAPAFLYKGEILGIMAAFKHHAVFNLWRGSQVVGRTGEEENAMGQFGRMTSGEDLPEASEFKAIIRKAMALADAGVKPPRTKKREAKPPALMPEDFEKALKAAPGAAENFESFSPSARRDYIEWVVGAKQAATRQRRIAQAAEWIAEGKKRNWKYEKC